MRSLATLIAFLVFVPAFAQSVQLIDSLALNLKSYSTEVGAFALYTLVAYYQRSDRDKALEYRQQAQQYLEDPLPKAQTYARMVEGIYHGSIGSMDSSVYWFTKAKESAMKTRDNKVAAISCSNLGRTLVSAGKAEEAVANLLEGLRLVDQSPDQELGIKLRINLVFAYLELKRYRDGISLGRHTLELVDSSLQWMALHVYNNVAVCYGALGMLDSARFFVERAIHDSEINRDFQSLANAHFILGTIYSNAGKNDLAIDQYEQAKPFREKVGNPLYIVSDLYTLASLYEKTGRYSKGVKTCLEALAVAREHNLLLKFENTYEVLALNYKGLGDFKKSSEYFELWAAAKDTTYRHANAQAIADMETKYETEKKEQRIALQNATIATQRANIQRDYLLIAGMGLVMVLIVMSLFLIRSKLRRRQEALRREYELSVRETFISASIQSQENERKRFAQDLHDGMGQLISGLRFILNPETAAKEESLSKADGILNDMHREIRGLAFNLMPQVLIQGGLLPAIQEMAARIGDTGQMKLHVNGFGLTGRFSELQEISLYRVVQEWVNNVLKYSKAHSVNIQLVAHEDEITLTIEDDGEGFDKILLENSAGNGWKNIQSRLHLIHATVEVDTQAGRKGTTFMVSMPLGVLHEARRKGAGASHPGA